MTEKLPRMPKAPSREEATFSASADRFLGNFTAERLARLFAGVVAERYGHGEGDGYYGANQTGDTTEDDLRRQLLDGTDDLIEIFEEVLRRVTR